MSAAGESRYDIGEPATPSEIARWDIDVMPDGRGLPDGSGTASAGRAIYAARCEQCHGENGVGGQFGSLVGRLPDDAFPFGRDASVERTIGNYWPYATTLFDYLRRAMPLDAPGTLSVDEIYSLVAYLLEENRIIEAGFELNQHNLAAIEMPARDRFVPDDRHGGDDVR
jgi:cytochrome c